MGCKTSFFFQNISSGKAKIVYFAMDLYTDLVSVILSSEEFKLCLIVFNSSSFSGVVLLTINVMPFQNVFDNTLSTEAMRALFIIGFTFIFIGLAAYESNVGPFHARQIEARGQNSVRTAFHL